MRGGVVVEAQRAGERVEHLLGRMRVAALLEPDVVVDADAGEQRELLAPQAGHPAPAQVGQSDVVGRDERAPGAEELAEPVVRVAHGVLDATARARPRRWPWRSPGRRLLVVAGLWLAGARSGTVDA